MTSPNEDKITTKLARKAGDSAKDIHKEYVNFYNWMLTDGEDPKREQGYNKSTADNHIGRFDQLHRFVIDNFDPDDLVRIQKDHADELMWSLYRGDITKQRSSDAGDTYSDSSIRKFQNALQAYFNWLYFEKEAIETPWESPINITDEDGKSADRFTYDELGQIFDAAKAYGSLPSYYECSPEKKGKIDALVAQRLGIPKEEVSRKDWLEADWSSKTHSLVTVAYDAGLAPKEIANARMHWYDSQARCLRIPSRHACKEREKELVGLSDVAADSLEEWEQESRQLSTYDDTDLIWLNQNGNPYDSSTLCYLLRRLCKNAEIPTENRKIVWYSLRQTMGRNVTHVGELSEANDQLRHKLQSTTQEHYNETPVEVLRNRINETHEIAGKARRDPEFNPFTDSSTQPAGDSDPRLSPSNTRANDFVDDARTTEAENRPAHETPPTNTTRDLQWANTEDVVTQTDDGGIHIDPSVLDTEDGLLYVLRLLLENMSNN